MQDYLRVPNTIITINSFSKYYGLPGIHLAWTIGKTDITTIISNYFHYPLNLFYEKIVLRVLDSDYLAQVKTHYNNERSKIINYLQTNRLDYWFELANTIVIVKKMSNLNNYNKLVNSLGKLKLDNFYKIIKESDKLLIKLFISTHEINQKILNEITSN